jgi:hypothetical protein
MIVGDVVKILQPSLLDPDHRKAAIGVVARLPLVSARRPKRLSDTRVLVRIGTNKNGTPRLRPVRPEHLAVL